MVGTFLKADESPGGAAQWPIPSRAIILSLDFEFPPFATKLGVEYESNIWMVPGCLRDRVPPLRGSCCGESDAPTTSVVGYDLASLTGLYIKPIPS